jgi:hypothetical protein
MDKLCLPEISQQYAASIFYFAYSAGCDKLRYRIASNPDPPRTASQADLLSHCYCRLSITPHVEVKN